MTENITPNGASYPRPKTPKHGEPRTVAGSVKPCFQAVADRIEYVKTKTDYLDPSGDGLRRIRQVASVAALKAIPKTAYGSEQVCFVARYGIYYFEIDSTAAVSEPWVVKPDDVSAVPVGDPANPGRWVHELQSLRGAPSGAATLDANGNLSAGQCDQRIIFLAEEAIASDVTVAATEADIDAACTIPGLKPGDRVHISIWGYARSTPSLSSAGLRARIQRPDAGAVDYTPLVSRSSTSNVLVSNKAIYTVVAEGNHVVILNAVQDGTSGTFVAATRIRVLVIRPVE